MCSVTHLVRPHALYGPTILSFRVENVSTQAPEQPPFAQESGTEKQA